jgi:4-carboxymuconolactone decarboxylase
MKMARRKGLLFALIWSCGVTAVAQDRMPEIPAAQLTPAQQKAAALFKETRGVPVFGPFVPLLRSPELMLDAKNMGDYLRYRNSLPLSVNEMIILLVARQWSQQVEWQIHYPAALKAGLRQSIADAIAVDRRPDDMSEAESSAWDFVTELQRDKQVSDAVYQRALAQFGEQGVIDMAGTDGYYQFLALTMSATRTAADPAKPLMPTLPDRGMK